MSERRLEGSVEALVSAWWTRASTPLLMCDASATIVGVNDSFTALVGPHASELVGDDLISVLGERDRSWLRNYVDRIAGGELDHVDAQVQLRRADGEPSECFLRIEAIGDTDGPSGLAVLVREIEVEHAADFDDRLRQLLAHIEDEITLIDRDGRILAASGQFRSTLGYPEEFWRSRTVLDILAPDERERVMEAFTDLLSRPGENITGEFAVIASDGSRAMLEADAVNLLDEPGIHAVVLTTRNISERLQTLEDLRLSRDTALGAVERLDHVIATIGHELRNPLHVVRGIAELLATAQLASREHDLATTLTTEIDHLAEVTAGLLESARSDTSRIEIRPTDVRAVVRDVATIVEAHTRADVNVTSSVDEQVPRWLELDEVRLRQILTNLTSNAAKYTDEGSISISCRRSGDQLEIEVADTGRGIAPADLERIFEKFLVGENAADEAGAGLGLSIVRHLSRLLGGEVVAASTVGVGSRFTVRLPMTECDAPDTDRTVVDTSDAGTEGVVMVVEDSDLNQQLAVAQLDVLGYGAVTFASGEEIIDAARDGIDLAVVAILMDLQLGGLDGSETTQVLRELGVQVPILGFTANAAAARRRTLHAAGMDDVLVKPVSLADLAAALRQVIGPATADDDHTSAPGPAEATPIVDFAVLDRLTADLGHADPVRSLVSTFLGELDARWAVTTSSSSDPRVRRREAHTLKSTARLVGATALANACEGIEHGRPDPVDITLARTTAELLGSWAHHGDAGAASSTGVDAP